MGLLLGGHIRGGAAAGVVKITTWNLSDTNLGGISTCGVTFNADGSITRIGDTGSISSDEWWTQNPEANVGLDYEVGFTAIRSGDTWSTAAATVNNFVRLDVARTWNVRVITKAAPSLKDARDVVFEIRTYPGSVSQDTNSNCSHSAEN